MNRPLCGIELEMPVVDLQTGESAAMAPCPYTDFDNGYNLPEMAIGPVDNLKDLNMLIKKRLELLVSHLRKFGLGLANVAEHPFADLTPEFYDKMCVPRPIYRYWRDVRHWNHLSGIDAKAHMSPSVEVAADRAVDAVNVMLGFAPAFIGIYANSPFEEGQPTGKIENRLSLWTRMFENSTYDSDRVNGQCDRYFESIKGYFEWMYGNNVIHALPWSYSNYKDFDDVFVPLSPVTYNDFFASKGVYARSILRNEKRLITPAVFHQEYFQFARFPDARIRFFLKDIYFPGDFMDVLDNFDRIAKPVYIEMRAPGTNLPDSYIRENAGDTVADSMIISVCALMKGLLCNMDEALRHLPEDFSELRRDAIQSSMADEGIKDLVARALDIARGGLDKDEQWMLAYPEYVLDAGMSNGMRGLRDFNAGKSLQNLVLERVLH